MGDTQRKILCTVAVLTRNSEATLKRALESVKDFSEIIVCDGGSKDRTLDIARAYGCKIVPQDPAFKDESGRIKDFSGVRNQTLLIASHDWYAYLDSDEVFTRELVAEIGNIIERGAEQAAYWIKRKYVVDEEIVDCAATYPAKQKRFFHCKAVNRFIKQIHERIELKEGTAVKTLENYMLVPLSNDPKVMRQKWVHYINLESARRGKISFWQWLLVCLENLKVSLLYLFRYGRNVVFCSGTKMPWALEWERHVYHFNLCRALWKGN